MAHPLRQNKLNLEKWGKCFPSEGTKSFKVYFSVTASLKIKRKEEENNQETAEAPNSTR